MPAEREISRQLRDGEAALAAACARHGCAWTVLRPTLVYGAGLDKSLTPIARRAMRLRLFPLPAGRACASRCMPTISRRRCWRRWSCPAAGGRILPIGGGERLPAGEMFARVRAQPAARHACRCRCRRGCCVWRRQLLPRLRGPLSRLDADLVADNDELQRLLGVHPRPFQPHASMWMAPR